MCQTLNYFSNKKILISFKIIILIYIILESIDFRNILFKRNYLND